ncbi:uncharacterized protein LOC127739061 [Mytilus californianus]|uniref:uncharacterized protein LOC127739061 n=1 Tax=Mytilus californianus TaxID=6549 RepID=UPI00224689AF|nr:uncharacterized protein LOC127739061 [Mytilus californianus]
MMDLIIRLREHSIKQTDYDRAYEKIFGTSGGWLIAACPHSVVYAAKSLLRGESPRDFVDLMRSFKHRPNILISDIANRVAASGNKITRMFYPFEGRVAENTNENLEKAKSGLFTWELGCLNEIGPETTVNQSISNEKNPTSGSSEHYSLFDWFHEDNTKDVKEILRKVSLVEGLGSFTNSQVVEQFFNSMRRDLYFLNEMSPAVHVFICRLMLQFHNEKSNNLIKKQQSKLFPTEMSLNQLGQLCQQFGDDINGIQTSIVENLEIREDHGSGNVGQPSDVTTQNTCPTATSMTDRSPCAVPLHFQELSQIQSALNSSARENYSIYSSLMLSTFEEKIRELTNTWDNLSDEERQAISLNMDYVSNVLFKCPSERRLSEVSSIFVAGSK